MKNFEKDAFVLGLINHLIKRTNKKMVDIIPDFEREKFIDFTNGLEFTKDDASTEKALKYIATECYKRVSKKFDMKV